MLFFEEISHRAKFIPDCQGYRKRDQLFTPIPMGSQRTALVPSTKEPRVFSFFPRGLAGSAVNRFVNIGNRKSSKIWIFCFWKMTVGGLDLSFPISLKIRRRWFCPCCWRHCSVGNGPKLRHQRKSNQIVLVAEKVPVNVGFFGSFLAQEAEYDLMWACVLPPASAPTYLFKGSSPNSKETNPNQRVQRPNLVKNLIPLPWKNYTSPWLF